MKRPFTIIDALSLKTFLPDTPIALTPDGSFVAYAVPLKSWLGRVTGDFLPTGAPSCVGGSEIWVTEIRTGKTKNLTSGWGTNWAPVWSPDGSQLTFYSDKNGIAQLWIWNRQTGETSLACKEATRGFLPADTPQWTPDGKRIAFKLRPKDESSTKQNQHEEKPPSITVWECGLEDAPKPLTGILAPIWWAEGCLADIGLVELETGRVSVLVADLRAERMAMSPDGCSLAVMLLTSEESAKVGKVRRDLCLLPIDGGEPIQVVLSLPLSHTVPFSWAPDSKRIACIINGHIWVVSREGGTAQNLTEGCTTGGFDWEEPPLWSADGRYIFGIADNQAWAISPDSKRVRSLTEGSPLYQRGVRGDLPRLVRGIVHAYDNRTIWTLNDTSLVVRTINQETKAHGFYCIDWDTGETRCLFEEAKWHGWETFPNVSAADNLLVYRAEDSSHPVDLWGYDAASEDCRRITALNPDLQEFRLGEVRLISYKSEDGRTLQAILLLPANYQPEKRYPLITWIYPGEPFIDYVNCFGVRWWPVDNLQIFASAGYAVLIPDMPQKEGGPAKQLLGLVLPAIDEIIKQGIVDPKRLGLVGHSYGGYCVNILITQTKRFRAAVSVFGMCDLVSFYGSMNSEGDNPFVGFVESGQVNLGCSLWEAPERYIENSPIFFLDKVETPLLLICGTGDEVDDRQAREMFSGLRRLSKRAVLVRYPNEAHSFDQGENAVDYWNRVLSWFDEHLKE